MGDTDRRTTIDGDQITDNTISASEMKVDNSPDKFKMLMYNPITEAFSWFYLIRGGFLR